MSDDAFRFGDVIAWRNCPRDASGVHGPSFAIAMRVVRHEPGLLMLYRGPGYPMRRRNSDRIRVEAFRHQPVRRLLDGWHEVPDWSIRHVLLGMNPDGEHAISVFRNAATGIVEFWYIDIIGPVRRRGRRLDFLEHGLDAVTLGETRRDVSELGGVIRVDEEDLHRHNRGGRAWCLVRHDTGSVIVATGRRCPSFAR